MIEWINDWMKEWKNERMKDWKNERKRKNLTFDLSTNPVRPDKNSRADSGFLERLRNGKSDCAARAGSRGGARDSALPRHLLLLRTSNRIPTLRSTYWSTASPFPLDETGNKSCCRSIGCRSDSRAEETWRRRWGRGGRMPGCSLTEGFGEEE